MNLSKSMNIILAILLSTSLIYMIILKEENNKMSKENQSIEEIANDQNLNQEEIEKEYDCNFTKTYHIVNTLDGYIAEVTELSYVVVDQYQSHSAMTHIIPTKLKVSLEENKNYEFTYTLKGKGIINDMEDIYSYLTISSVNESQNDRELTNLSVTLTIKETDKLGLEQIQENICQSSN